MTEVLTAAEIAARIALVRENLRDLIEEAAGFSGAADESRTSERIATEEAELERLLKMQGQLGG